MVYSQDLDEVYKNDIIHYIQETFEHKVTTIVLDTFLEIQELHESALYLTYLTNNGIKLFIKKALYSEADVAILPHKECMKAIKSYNLSTDYKQTLQTAFTKQNLSKVDILTANEDVVFQSVIFGDVYGLNSEVLPDDSLTKRIKRFFTNLKRVKFNSYKIKTQEGNSVDCTATGILVYEHNLKAAKNSLINEDLSLHDGQLNAMILAPKSIVSYIYLLFVIYFYQKFSISKLPKSVGLVKAGSINVSMAKEGVDYFVDLVALSSKEVDLKVNKDALNLHLHTQVDEAIVQNDEKKEKLITKELPQGEYQKLLLKKSLPLFKKAQSEDFKELFTTLRNNATLSASYTVLMLFSTLIATVGLFLNSGPVIIGAMILAPLMAPIVSLSMGIVRDDDGLIKTSLWTIFGGVILALLASAFFTLLMPTLIQTGQIQARMQPNLLDLFVAIFSGVAAAYANAKEEIAKSLAGVAIAVALVPPLAVAGIGIGWLDFAVVQGSLLLFITNLVGITIASSLTFVILGYAPIKRAKKGILYTALMLAVIIVPLTFAFLDMVWQNSIHKKITQNTTINLQTKKVDYKVNAIQKLDDAKVLIELELVSNKVLDTDDLKMIKKEFQNRLDSDVELQVTTKLII